MNPAESLFPEKSMNPMACASVPTTRDLVSFWNESRLRADRAVSSSVRSAPGTVPWRTALEDVLRVGYGVETQSRYTGGGWEQVRRLTTPSAGALYPFEVFAIVAGEGIYFWDLDRGRLVSCGRPPLSHEELTAAGFVTAPEERLQALLVLVARPWRSMLKYHQRGYAYSHLDVGHVTTNLAIYTTALGHSPVLHLRFARATLAAHLGLDGLCREPLAALSFSGSAQPVATGDAPAAPPAAVVEPPGERELLNWESLRGILSFDRQLEPPCDPVRSMLLVEPEEASEDAVLPLPAGRVQPSAAREWRSAILGRRSAKGFRDEPVSLAQVAELLAALRGEGFPTDFSLDDSARLGVRLVARNVDGLAGVFAYSPQTHALHRIDAEENDPRPACMHQEIAGDAAALLIFHAPVCPLLEAQGYSAFAELHFRAAEMAQRLYLAASRISAVGMSCIGGFDSGECASLAGLTGDDEALYVILLGIPDERAVKHDRQAVAFSHGHTSRQDG